MTKTKTSDASNASKIQSGKIHSGDLLYFLDEQIASASNRFAKSAYQKAKATIKAQGSDFPVLTGTKRNPILASLPLTEHMIAKLYEFAERLAAGEVEIDQASHMRADFISKASGFLGIGEKLATTLFDAGAHSVGDLSKPKFCKLLPKQVQIQLQYGAPSMIPYQEIEAIASVLQSFPAKFARGAGVCPQYPPAIVGSFRRRKPLLKDLDILICATSGTRALAAYHDYLSSKFGEVPLLTRGPKKMSVLVLLGAKKYIKADVFFTTPDTYYSHLFYATGSKEFNIRVRKQAARLGLMLNQYGIWKDGVKLNSPADDEAALCAMLGVEYLAPPDRLG